ncbi:MAG: hypothetical protein ACE5GG_05030 [Candidatus Omnitrophota bacterium]
MKTGRIVAFIFLGTGLCLGYVCQQTRIVRLCYERQHKTKVCRNLIDENMSLRYNIIQLASSRNLTRHLEKLGADYEIADFSRVVELRPRVVMEKVYARRAVAVEKESMFSSLFSPRAEAQTDRLPY